MSILYENVFTCQLLLVDSVPSLGVYYFFVVDSVCWYVCMFVCHGVQIDSSFLFLDGIEPFFGHHLSMWHVVLRFWI